mgnify:CR=1 FL=1
MSSREPDHFATSLSKSHTCLARVKHKQEMQALRTELSKLQSESKSGMKGKETAQKEVDALKKKVGVLDTCRYGAWMCWVCQSRAICVWMCLSICAEADGACWWFVMQVGDLETRLRAATQDKQAALQVRMRDMRLKKAGPGVAACCDFLLHPPAHHSWIP